MEFDALVLKWMPSPLWRPAVTLTFDPQNLIRSLVRASEYSVTFHQDCSSRSWNIVATRSVQTNRQTSGCDRQRARKHNAFANIVGDEDARKLRTDRDRGSQWYLWPFEQSSLSSVPDVGSPASHWWSAGCPVVLHRHLPSGTCTELNVLGLITTNNKAIINIRLHPHCAIPPLPLRPIGSIACAWKFSKYYLRLSGILNNPFCIIGDWMITSTATLQRLVQRRLPMLLYRPENPSKLPLPMGGSAPHLIHGFVGPAESSSKMACWSVQSFLHSAHKVSHYFTMGCCFPQKSPLPLGWSGPHLTHGTYGPPESSTQMASRSVHQFSYGSQMLCCTMHCQWEKSQNCPFPLGFHHSGGGGPSHGHRSCMCM